MPEFQITKPNPSRRQAIHKLARRRGLTFKKAKRVISFPKAK